jgi:hypothetical protein
MELHRSQASMMNGFTGATHFKEKAKPEFSAIAISFTALV